MASDFPRSLNPLSTLREYWTSVGLNLKVKFILMKTKNPIEPLLPSFRKSGSGSSHHGSAVNKPNYYPWGHRFDPWPCSVDQGSGVAVSGGVGWRHGSDPALLWLRLWPAAVAPIRPLAWEPPRATGTALKSQKNKTNKKKKTDYSGSDHCRSAGVGLIPRPVQWVKGFGSDSIPCLGTSMCYRCRPKSYR